MARSSKESLTLYIDRVITAHYIENDDSFLLRGINDGAWKLFYLENGALTADMGNGPQIVDGGCAVFCGPGEFYAISAYERPSNLLILSFECLDTVVHKLRGKVVPISAAMKVYLQNILRELKRNDSVGADVTSLPA